MLMEMSLNYSIICERLDELNRVVKFKKRSRLSKDFTEDFQNYLIIMSALDGYISIDDVNQINLILGTSWTGIEIKSYVEEKHILDEEFMSTVPSSLKQVLALENKIGNSQLSDFIISFFNKIAELFSVNTRQIDFYNKYISLIRDYREGIGGNE